MDPLDDLRHWRVMAYNDALTVLKSQPLQPGYDPAETFARLYRTLLAAHEHVQTGEWPADLGAEHERFAVP